MELPEQVSKKRHHPQPSQILICPKRSRLHHLRDRSQPTKTFLDSILTFPSPSSLTDIKPWHGMIAQASYAFSKTEIMKPIRHLLSSKVPFAWSPEFETAVQASKKEIIEQCELGVRSFNPLHPTCLATDWSKLRIGYWLCQKRCPCPA